MILGIPAFLFSQSSSPVKKLHAYKQANLPGILPRLPGDENNKQRSERKETYNYYLYIEVAKKENISVSAVYISGKKVKIKTDTIIMLPVAKLINTEATIPDTVTLVKATKNRVVMITPYGEITSTAAINAFHKKLIRENELVVFYRWKGKTYFNLVKKMTTLAPDAHV